MSSDITSKCQQHKILLIQNIDTSTLIIHFKNVVTISSVYISLTIANVIFLIRYASIKLMAWQILTVTLILLLITITNYTMNSWRRITI